MKLKWGNKMARTIIESEVIFGNVYKDSVSGFTGAAVVMSKFQYGCLRVGLQPKVTEKGNLPSIEYFDEGGLVDVTPIDKTPGGPRNDFRGF